MSCFCNHCYRILGLFLLIVPQKYADFSIVVYENSSDEFDIGHCPIKVKVKVTA